MQELFDLRNKQGASLSRVGIYPTLVSLGSHWRLLGRTDATDDVMAARELLRAAIGDLPAKERDLLLAQFAFTYEQAARERREGAYLEDAQRQGGEGSISSFRRWSHEGIEGAARRIVERATLPVSDLIPVAHSGQSTPYVVEQFHIRYRFKEGRLTNDSSVEVRIKSLAVGGHSYLAHFIYFSDMRSGATRIEPEFGCDLFESWDEKGVAFSNFRLAKVCGVGESFTFMYRIIVNSETPTASTVFHTPDMDASHLDLEIQFAADALPSRAWYFSHKPYVAAQLEENRRQAKLAYDGSRIIRKSWDSLRAGFSYGVDWDWHD
jgi:hypothetical protein